MYRGCEKMFRDYTSAATNCMDDLDGITRLKAMLGIGTTWNNFLIDLHGNTAARQGHGLHQLFCCIAIRDGSWFTINNNFHTV